MPSSSTTSSAPSATSSSASSGNSGPTSSPLLFFVALGFGVVFTNLWIIVGVKYCFRYNQRNRQLRAAEDGEPIDLGAMPRAHRRRREKKLMTMEEVNERFPLTKYKAWMTTRAEEGLPTAGGISTAVEASRPASIKNEDGALKEAEDRPKSSAAAAAPQAEASSAALVRSSIDTLTVNEQTEHSSSPEIAYSPTLHQEFTSPEISSADGRPSTAKSARTTTDDPTKEASQDEPHGEAEEDEDQIQTAVPTEQLPDPGDACAICLDTIEEDDDIRGLTCGHAFHASCVDPWLTSRRACCPLCKADYYVPKPRPEGADATTEATGRRTRNPNMPAPPQYAFMGGGSAFGGRRPTMVLPGRFMTVVYNENDRHGFPQLVREPRPGRAERRAMRRASSAAFRNTPGAADATANVEGQTGQVGQEAQSEPAAGRWRRRLFHNFNVSLPYPHRGNSRQNGEANGTTPVEEPSPAQLEAGRA